MPAPDVLVVEDTEAIRLSLADSLADAGYRVRTAADGLSGLAAARTETPDLVILDIMLPRVDGYDVCRSLRAEGHAEPILLLTVRGAEQDIVHGLELGADDYVVKPFRLRELLARVAALLRRNLPTTPITIGDARFDFSSRRLSRDSKEVVLTPKERGVLELFLSRPGRVWTRNEILDRVWGRSMIVTNRSVDRCVKTLRAKIEPEPSEPRFLCTVREVGYRLDLEGEGK